VLSEANQYKEWREKEILLRWYLVTEGVASSVGEGGVLV
jgi:hypothetical protein